MNGIKKDIVFKNMKLKIDGMLTSHEDVNVSIGDDVKIEISGKLSQGSFKLTFTIDSSMVNYDFSSQVTLKSKKLDGGNFIKDANRLNELIYFVCNELSYMIEVIEWKQEI